MSVDEERSTQIQKGVASDSNPVSTMIDCDDINPDDTHYDVTLMLPVTLRFWAADEASAREQFSDVEMTVTGPQISSSTGFPQDIVIKQVDNPALAG